MSLFSNMVTSVSLVAGIATFPGCGTFLNRLLKCSCCACWSCAYSPVIPTLPFLLSSVMHPQLWERGGRTPQKLSSLVADVWGPAWRITWPKVAWRMWCCWRSLSWRLDPPGTLYVYQSLHLSILWEAEGPSWTKGSQGSWIQWMWRWTKFVNGKVSPSQFIRPKFCHQIVCFVWATVQSPNIINLLSHKTMAAANSYFYFQLIFNLLVIFLINCFVRKT